MTDPLSLNLTSAKASAGSVISDSGAAMPAGAGFDAILAASIVPEPAPKPAEPAIATPVDMPLPLVAVAGKLPETGKRLPVSDLPVSDLPANDGNDAAETDDSDDRTPLLALLPLPVNQDPAPHHTSEAASATTSRTANLASAPLPLAAGRAEPLSPAPATPVAAPQPAVAVAAAAAMPMGPAVTMAVAMPGTAPAVRDTAEKPAKPANAELSPRSLATVDSNLPAISTLSASPSGQGDSGQGQPPMADQSGTTPAGPSPIASPEAARGPALAFTQPQPTPAAVATPPAQIAAPAGHDMSALVDRLVEARAAARSGNGMASVATSVRHAEFGRISLRFDTSGDGLSVSMTSSDPGFAPAAQAALAAQPAVSATASGQSADNDARQGQSGSTAQQFSGQPQQQPRPQGQAASTGFATAARAPAGKADSTEAGSAPAQAGVFA